jgi:ribosomal protein S27E
MPKLDTLMLVTCLNCGKDKTFLRVMSTSFMLNQKESHNDVVICADCGAIMVRVGGMVDARYFWACHVPQGNLVME